MFLQTRNRTRRTAELLLATLALTLPSACVESAADAAHTSTTTSAVPGRPVLANAEIDGWRSDLLAVAYEAASELPLHTHHKNRARAQDQVVVASLLLDQPATALEQAEGIENWRRGTGYADLAHYCFANDLEGVEFLLARAEDVARSTEQGESAQKWRRDRILAKMARVWSLRGERARSLEILAGIEDSEKTTVQVAESSYLESDDVDAFIGETAAAAKAGNFELVKVMLLTGAELYGRFYADEELRSKLKQSAVDSWGALPTPVRIDILLSFASSAVENGDTDGARQLIEEAQGVYDSLKFTIDFQVDMRSRIAVARYEAGQEAEAIADLDELRESFEAGKGELADMFRAAAALPLAEALVAVGKPDLALSVYRTALEDGDLNPNSRPTAEDLVRVACSMATQGVQPDGELWTRLRQIRGELSDPW